MSLKTYAIEKGKFIGNLMRDGMFDNLQVNNGLTDNLLKTEYNALVLGNKMKMSNLLRTRPQDPFNIKIGDINTANIDKFIAYADKYDMRKRGHVMIWYNQIPSWLKIEAPEWSAQQIYDFSKSYILALSSYCKGKIDEWDVINEAIVNNGFRRILGIKLSILKLTQMVKLVIIIILHTCLNGLDWVTQTLNYFIMITILRRLEPQKIILCGLL